MEFFVDKDSIVRKIWGKSDTILFIFAGAAAEFALNKAVDWLYFTGRLPKDPLGRLFSTVEYARMIVFSEREKALKTIDNMAAIHVGVEKSRGAKIPDWAYRDVLYMLIDYSIRSFELLERKLSEPEKAEVFQVFYNVGARMGLKDLPDSYELWVADRSAHLQQNLEKSTYTKDLFRQYRKHLGSFRYMFLLEAQLMVLPERVISLLELRKYSLLWPALYFYKLIARMNMGWLLKSLLLPAKNKVQIKALDTSAS